MQYKKRITNILREVKCGKVDSNELKLPIFHENKILAFLEPVSHGLTDNEAFINDLSEWRSANCQAFPTVFKVTKEGTKKWVKEQLLNREDRILFMVVTLENKPLGHMGLSNFDFIKREAEIVDVVRGIHGIFPGVFTLALHTLVQWAFNKLRLKRLFLRVFLDGERAIKMYRCCGFSEVRKIPLHKNVKEGVIKFEEIPENDELSVDRVFLLMELVNK